MGNMRTILRLLCFSRFGAPSRFENTFGKNLIATVLLWASACTAVQLFASAAVHSRLQYRKQPNILANSLHRYGNRVLLVAFGLGSCKRRTSATAFLSVILVGRAVYVSLQVYALRVFCSSL